MADKKLSSEADAQKRITALFRLFDENDDNTIDSRVIGDIMYALGCFPSKAHIQLFVAEIEEETSTFVHLDKFLPAMTKVLMENKFPPVPEERLRQAFQALDKENKGYLEAEELRKFMTEEGEVFSQEEMDEMLYAVANNENNRVYCEDLIARWTKY